MTSTANLPRIPVSEELFLAERPLLDVRAPVEFAQGAFPHAVNRPLLTDDERHQVGIRYKQAGQDAAIRLGYTLVDEHERARRVAEWTAFARQHPEGLLYCFRGGLRSRLTQEMLASDAGIVYPRVTGGYKAMRRFLLDRLAMDAERANLIILAGRTGSGKTPFLHRLQRAIDLEGRANHKGSAFGRRARPQPSQIELENAIAIDLMRQLAADPRAPIVLEDESRSIGSRQVPLDLFDQMSRSPLVLLEVPYEARIEQGVNDYILNLFDEYRMELVDEERARAALREHILSALDRVQRRLGGQRHRAFRALAQEALEAWFAQGDMAGLRALIGRMLSEYYDPMYDYQLGKKRDRIIFRGDPDTVADWLNQRMART